MHSPLKRIVPGAENAVLFVHGINATPRFFDDFAAQLPPDWSIHNLLLPGHGGTVKDFGAHSAREWEAHVRASIDELRRTHGRIYIVAHSLGTLLSIREAVRDASRIEGMLLLCVPLRIWSRPTAWLRNISRVLAPERYAEEIRTCYGTEVDWRLWRYIGWIPRYLELFALSADARKKVAALKVPTRVYMAGRDEQVSMRSERCMAEVPSITLHRMPKSSHHRFTPEDRQALLDAMLDMCHIRPEF